MIAPQVVFAIPAQETVHTVNLEMKQNDLFFQE